MSTIGSDYSAHRRSVDDLEQDYETATRRAEERERRREAKLEKNLEHALKKKEADAEDSVRTVKDHYESALHDQAKSDRIERERYKRSLYDRNGRHSAALADTARVERDAAIEASNAAQARAEKAIAESESYSERQAAAAEERHQRDLEALADRYRKQIEEARGGETDDERAETARYRKKLAEESQAAIRQAREEVMSERRQAKALSEQSDFVMKERGKKADALLEARLHEKDLAQKKELNDHSEAERVSRATELQPLREQLADTALIRKDAERQRNQARAGAIRELETDWNAKYANQSLAHDLEKQKLHAEVADADRLYGNKLATVLKENDTNTTRLIADTSADHRDQMTAAAREYDRSLAHAKMQADHDRKNSEALLARERQAATDRQDRALATQAETYRTTIANQRKNQGAQIANLERILNVKNSTSDAGEISAGAEASVRAAVTREYDKTFQAEAERNAGDREHLANTYHARLSDAYRDNQTLATNLNRQSMKEQTLMRNEFVQHVTDVEENKRQMLNLAADANLKMSESTGRSHEREMNEMRRHYEDLIASRDQDHAMKFAEYRNQAEFEKRSMRRDYQAQTADLIRSYEKKLTDQKTTAEEALREVKAKLDTKTRETDKRLMQALADQARGYDHRMAELEAQSKGRERALAQQHEDELDKVKKANALLLSKKG